MDIRVGFGYDVHPLTEGREMWLGGVKLESALGPDGHSDADVLIHAICDALLGAADLRDIGFHFNNSDPRWQDKRSTHFLEETCRMISDKGWKISNIDSTLSLEAPKINPHVPAMKTVLASCTGLSPDRISIKATTNEKLGYVGRQEGVNAYAVALIIKE